MVSFSKPVSLSISLSFYKDCTMKYTCEIIIDKPLDEVIALFDNPENLKEWQPGLIELEHLSGEPGLPGAKARLKYNMGNRDVEMIETILTRNLPEEFSGTYEAKNVYNIVKNTFEAVGESKTKWTAFQEFKLYSFMKLFGWFMPGSFKKQSMKYMEYFKEFAENQD